MHPLAHVAAVFRSLQIIAQPRLACSGEDSRVRHDEGLEDRHPSAARRVWNKLPAAVTQAVLELALKEPELSPRMAVSFVDQQTVLRVAIQETRVNVHRMVADR